jgi:PAS domain S-box-containing protein
MERIFDKKITFQLMVEASPNSLILIDKSGIIIYINQFTEKLFQYSKTELIGKRLEILIPEKYVKTHPANRNSFMNNPKTRSMGLGRDLYAKRKDNSEFPTEIGLNSIKIDNNMFVMATVIDISERKRYENEILLRNKQLAELSDKLKSINIELDRKNTNIKESIDYAQKIQYSILPNIQEIQSQIPSFSVYYNPKDVIGGDFYWFYQEQDINYLAVIDCTGHSVPGAMIAMVVYSLLKEVLHSNYNQTTAEILSSLHRELYKFLQQDKGEEYSQVGCDISLCKIDKQNNKLQFSGARQDLYIYNGNEVSIIKSTSKSIGGYSLIGTKEPERNFKTENIEIAPNMLFAMTTDGVLDQLNQKDEVFGTQSFISLIQNNYNNSSEITSNNFKQTIEKWKENTNQQDDMLTLTFRI